MAKMTQTEWFNMFDTKSEHEINEFLHSDKTLFGNEDITTELKFAVGTVIRNMFRVKMEINQVRHCVYNHVLNIADYTKDGNSTSKLMRIIRSYISVFISRMDIQHNINVITDIAGKKMI